LASALELLFLFILSSRNVSGLFLCQKPPGVAGHYWLTPVFLANQEAEIRRIAVQSQPGQIVHETLSGKKTFTKIGLVECLKV
jgi:hypothetical protein